MPEQDKPIVINDRRKFRGDGELRDPLPATEPVAATPEPVKQNAPASGPIAIDSVHTNSAHLVTPVPEPVDDGAFAADEDELAAQDAADAEEQRELPPPPTPEEIEQVRAAYEQTSERLDTMMRSQNLGAERVPPMDFQRLVQSIYMSAMMQLGAGTQQGQQPRVDLIGAKQSIDMLAVISDKAGSNLSETETMLLESALFELRMGFLEITQLLARQAAAKQQAPPTAPGQTGAGGFGGSGFTGAGHGLSANPTPAQDASAPGLSASGMAELIFLGTGTSMGVPTLGCPCAVCHSTHPHNNRLRASIALRFGERVVLIDTGQDFRTQPLRAGINHVDAVLYTHGHADHILGFDDLRPLTFGKPDRLPLYADDSTAETIERIFDYTFKKRDRYPTSARVDLHRLSSEPGTSLELFGACFERIPVLHGRSTIAGYRFGRAAYLTDMSDIPEASFDRLRDLDIVILDALRREPHPSHSHLDNSIAIAARIGAKETYFTHISHDLDHGPTEENLPPVYIWPTTACGCPSGLQTRAFSRRGLEMIVFRGLDEVPADFGPTIVTIGNFDGVHCGHQSVIREVVQRARERNARAVLITLDPHPAKVLRPEYPLRLITGLEQKLELLHATELDAVLLLPFSTEFARTSAASFCGAILRDTLHALEIHEGADFRLGHRGEAGMEHLVELGQQFGFTTRIFAPLHRGREIISSSRIRTLIAAGEVGHARRLLGRSFAVDSTPARGRGYGSKYAVPTVNLAPYENLLPANGVYVTDLQVGTGADAIHFEGVTNVGNRPTFGADSFAVETYLLRFQPFPLDEQTPLRLTFQKRLREERKWPSTDALKQQIGIDVGRAERWFALRRLISGRVQNDVAQ